MSELILAPNLPNPDEFYEELLKCHEGLSEEASHALNAKLVLILANHIGDQDIIAQAMTIARNTSKA